MLFTEPTFLFLFLPLLLALYFAPASTVHGRYANWLLLAASGCSVARTVFELAQPCPFAIALDSAVGRRRLTGVLGRVGSLSPVTFALLAAASSVRLVGAAVSPGTWWST